MKFIAHRYYNTSVELVLMHTMLIRDNKMKELHLEDSSMQNFITLKLRRKKATTHYICFISIYDFVSSFLFCSTLLYFFIFTFFVIYRSHKWGETILMCGGTFLMIYFLFLWLFLMIISLWFFLIIISF